MEAGVTSFTKRLQTSWLTDAAAQARIAAIFDALVPQLQAYCTGRAFVITCDSAEATLAAVLAALATQTPAFLGNPQWTQAEKTAAREKIGGGQLWLTDLLPENEFLEKTQPRHPAHSAPEADRGATEADSDSRSAAETGNDATEANGDFPSAAEGGARNIRSLLPDAHNDGTPPLRLASVEAYAPAPLPPHRSRGCLMLPTGGTGGTLKFARHNWQTLSAAVDGYARFWNALQINCVCALPVFHIGGLMLALRSFITHGRLCLLPWKQLQAAAEHTPQRQSCERESVAAAAKPIAPTGNDAKRADLSAEPACGASAIGAQSGDTAATPPLPDIFVLAPRWHISLVPTQVQHLLQSEAAVRWLRRMEAILTGGGATPESLLRAAVAAALPLAPAYGMTETAATIALQRPEVFLRCYHKPAQTAQENNDSAGADAAPDDDGGQSTGMPLSEKHATGDCSGSDDDSEGNADGCSGTQQQTNSHAEAVCFTPAGVRTGTQQQTSFPPWGELLPHLAATTEPETGRIVLSGESLFHGYYPDEPQVSQAFATGDCGRLDAAGRLLQVCGRLDRIVTSGGKKIDPAIVEREILRQAQRLNIAIAAVFVCGVADGRWGERLVAFVEYGNDGAFSDAARGQLNTALRAELGAYRCPKQWIGVVTLPLDERGKPDRARIATLAADSGL